MSEVTTEQIKEEMEVTKAVVAAKPNLHLSPIKQEAKFFLNLADHNALAGYCEAFMGGDLVPFTKVHDTMMVYLWSLQKGLAWLDCLSHVCLIPSGGKIKVGPDAFLTRAMLHQAGIFCETVYTMGEPEDFRSIYQYFHKDSVVSAKYLEKNPEEYKVYPNLQVLNSAASAGTIPKGIIPVVPSEQPIDYRTRLKFTRYYGNHTQTEIVSFTWTEAQVAGLTEKSNWKNYPADCLYARTYTRGARRIGADVMAGSITMEEHYTETNQDLPESYFEEIRG